jgi:hypothetical protein
MFHHVGALLDAIVNLISFRFLAGHNRTDIFHKIHAALFTRAAFALFVFASWAFKTERGVTARTKSRNFARVSGTLWAFDHALRNRLSVKGRSAWNSRVGWRSQSSVCTARRGHARLRSRGCGRNGSSFRRYIARLTGRESPTHAHILAGYQTQNSAAQKMCCSALTVHAYRRENVSGRGLSAAAKANAFAAASCLREINLVLSE